jgi:transcriptional regulator with XRE-family HTH domain
MAFADIGQQLRAYRLESGLRAEEIAARLGVSRAALYRYEKGEVIKLDTIRRLAELLKISPLSLLGSASSTSPARRLPGAAAPGRGTGRPDPDGRRRPLLPVSTDAFEGARRRGLDRGRRRRAGPRSRARSHGRPGTRACSPPARSCTSSAVPTSSASCRRPRSAASCRMGSPPASPSRSAPAPAAAPPPWRRRRASPP